MSSDIAYLFSHPLVHGDAHAALEGGALDLEGERRTLRASLTEADRAVRVRFDAATVDSLRALMTHGTKVLHYSGHGFENALALENGRGALHPAFTVDKLSALFSAGGGGSHSRGADDGADSGTASTSGVQLVFVAACNSEYVGRAFVAAGVPHVVAVRCAMADGGSNGSGSGNESSTAGLVSDQAARVFVRSFYLVCLTRLAFICHSLICHCSLDDAHTWPRFRLIFRYSPISFENRRCWSAAALRTPLTLGARASSPIRCITWRPTRRNSCCCPPPAIEQQQQQQPRLCLHPRHRLFHHHHISSSSRPTATTTWSSFPPTRRRAARGR
jgi:hypothetical protein